MMTLVLLIDDFDEDLGDDADGGSRRREEYGGADRVRKMPYFRHFCEFLGWIFGALDGTQFLLCVVEGREVALTPGVELPGVGPPGAGVSAQALAP